MGFRERLPRTPAVYERKVRWRKYDQEDFALELKANYKSTFGLEQTIEEQYAEEERLGMMMRLPLAEDRRLYGDRLRIAPTAAIENAVEAVRTLHDGTHGAAVNPNLRVRDQSRCPANSDLKRAIALLHETPGQSFILKLDVSKAHRRFLHRKSDWGLLACRLADPEVVWLNKVGTFGLGCASYWWGRLFSIVTRAAIALARMGLVFFSSSFSLMT